jgi:hypothetical protein
MNIKIKMTAPNHYTAPKLPETINDPVLMAQLAEDPLNKQGMDESFRRAALDALASETADEGTTNYRFAENAQGGYQWAAEYPNGMTLMGSLRSSNDVHPQQKRQPTNQQHENSLSGGLTHVIIETEDNEKILIRKTSGSEMDARSQAFDMVSTKRAKDDVKDKGTITPIPLDTDALKDVVLKPGQPMQLGFDKLSGKSYKAPAKITRITGMRMDAGGRVEPTHPWLNNQKRHTDARSEFNSALRNIREGAVAQRSGPAAVRNTVPAPTQSFTTEQLKALAAKADEEIRDVPMEAWFRDPVATQKQRELDGLEPMDPDEYQRWLANRTDAQMAKLNNMRRIDLESKAKHKTVREKLLGQVPELYEAKLPAELAERLGDTPYAIGFNQSGTDDLFSAGLELDDNQEGISINRQNLGHRFLMYDEASGGVLGTERTTGIAHAVEEGYYHNSSNGRFVAAFPLARPENRRSSSSGQPVSIQVNLDNKKILPADAIKDYVDDEGHARSAYSGKYIAGYIDDKGVFWANKNFARADKVDFQPFARETLGQPT